ncbi:hypothetical protein [Neobacillus sp. D3-1R]|uniref:hypothetical protein n=1 Tax=Neobacillus sp. D3-1R TaxID=3445778 RepID=UPI003F9F2DD5
MQAVKVIIIFFALYDLSFKIAPSLSLGKITVILLTIYYLFGCKNKTVIFKSEAKVFILYFFILLHVIVIYVLNGMPETTTLARVIYYFIYSIWLSIIFASIFKNKDEFLKLLSIAIFIQSCFVLISWISIDYRILIDNLLVQTGNISLFSGERPPGLMNSAGAKASVILGIGASICLYQITVARNFKSVVIYALMLLVNAIATFIIGRTGLLILAVLLLSLLLQKSKKLLLNKRFIFIVPAIFLCSVLVSRNIPDDIQNKLDYKVKWVQDEFSQGLLKSDTVIILREMPIKELGLDTLIGTSQIRPPGFQNDSGYIQNYHSIGFIFTIIFYITIIIHIISFMKLKKNREFVQKNILFIMTLILGLFVVEIKEPFIFSYSYMFIILSMLRIN